MAKTSWDPRRIKRENAVKALFEYSFGRPVANNAWAAEVVDQLDQVDELIRKSAPEWPVDKLNRIDLAILRLAVYELLTGETPPKVVIDEAVEIAKNYGADGSPRFVNGALGHAIRILKIKYGE